MYLGARWMIKYLSVDPGEANGIAGYNDKAQLQFMQVVTYDGLTRFLGQLDYVEICICEEYRVYPHKAQKHIYNKLLTPRAIGKVETWAELHGVRLIMQAATHKGTGFKYLGKKEPPRSNPLSHAIVAHAHFTYWAVVNKVIKPEELI